MKWGNALDVICDQEVPIILIANFYDIAIGPVMPGVLNIG